MFEDLRWEAHGLETLAQKATDATLVWIGLEPKDFEISLLACDDARIAALNADFRGKLKATNVLSWPSEERAAELDGQTPDLPDTARDTELGDIAIAYETCVKEASKLGKTLSDHTVHLLVHGTLHLLGYDHERDRDATLMEGLETQILGKLGIADPYKT